MKKLFFFLFVGFVAWQLPTAQPTDASSRKNLKQAKKLISSQEYVKAISYLTQTIDEKPKHKEAHFLLGVCYINVEDFNQADFWFEKAYELKPGYSKKIGLEYFNAADHSYNKSGEFKHKKEILTQAGSLFKKATEYNPKLKKKGYDFFVKLGDGANLVDGVDFYEQAAGFTDNIKRRKKMAYQLLTVAANKWPSDLSENVKIKAVGIIGQEKVDEIFPPPYKSSIFERTYTEADAGKDGYIYTFSWSSNIKKGDVLEAIGRIPGQEYFDAEEIRIWRGKKFKPKWYKTIDGYFSIALTKIPKRGKNVIQFKKNSGIEVTVKIIRETVPRPNSTLLNKYIQDD